MHGIRQHKNILDPIHETPWEGTSRAVALVEQSASTRSQEVLLTRLIQKQQHLTLQQLKQKKAEGEKQRKYLQSLIKKNRTQKERAFTVREYDHLLVNNQKIRQKIELARNMPTTSTSSNYQKDQQFPISSFDRQLNSLSQQQLLLVKNSHDLHANNTNALQANSDILSATAAISRESCNDDYKRPSIATSQNSMQAALYTNPKNQSQRVLRFADIEPYLKNRHGLVLDNHQDREFHELILRKAKENRVPIFERKKSSDCDGIDYNESRGRAGSSINSS